MFVLCRQVRQGIVIYVRQRKRTKVLTNERKKTMEVKIVKSETASATRYGLCHANNGKLLRGTLLRYKTRKGAEQYAQRHGYTIIGETK